MRSSTTPGTMVTMNQYHGIMIWLGALLLISVFLTGCVERTIKITSEPPGALVYLNDEEIGRTPCDTSFTFYGTYDVRLVLDGYEPYMGPAEAATPIYQQPGLDLLVETLPIRFRNVINWHFELQKVDVSTAQMVDRAKQLRARMHGETPVPNDNTENTQEESPQK